MLAFGPFIISIIQGQCLQGPCLSLEGGFWDGYGQENPHKAEASPLSVSPSIPLTGPRPVFLGWSLTILHHMPCSVKAPADHTHGISSSLLFLFPRFHQEVYMKCQSDKCEVIFYCELLQLCSGAQIYSLKELLTACRREL